MKKGRFAWILGLALTAALAAGPAPAAQDTLVVVQEAEPVGLDIMQSSIQTTMSACYNLHDTLFHPQEDASVLPALAEKWEKVDDLTWKIMLRKDAVFHNGEPVTAWSFVNAWNYGANQVNAQQNNSFYAGIAGYAELNPEG